MSITITEVRNAASLQADNLRMDVEINHPVHGWLPYTVDPSDTDTTISNNEVMGLIGDKFVAYVPPTQAELDSALAVEVRGERDTILTTVVDPMVSNPLRWADLTDAQKTTWSTYRTDLLAVPQQVRFPQVIDWPIKP